MADSDSPAFPPALPLLLPLLLPPQILTENFLQIRCILYNKRACAEGLSFVRNDKLDKARTEMSVLIQLFLIYRLKPARKEIFNEQNYYHRTGIWKRRTGTGS